MEAVIRRKATEKVMCKNSNEENMYKGIKNKESCIKSNETRRKVYRV